MHWKPQKSGHQGHNLGSFDDLSPSTGAIANIENNVTTINFDESIWKNKVQVVQTVSPSLIVMFWSDLHSVFYLIVFIKPCGEHCYSQWDFNCLFWLCQSRSRFLSWMLEFLGILDHLLYCLRPVPASSSSEADSTVQSGEPHPTTSEPYHKVTFYGEKWTFLVLENCEVVGSNHIPCHVLKGQSTQKTS